MLQTAGKISAYRKKTGKKGGLYAVFMLYASAFGSGARYGAWPGGSRMDAAPVCGSAGSSVRTIDLKGCGKREKAV